MRPRVRATGLLIALAGITAAAPVGTARTADSSTASDGAVAPATVLDRYLTGLKSLRTQFTQTVTDAHGGRTDAGSGSLTVQRPDKFRWDYRPAAGGAAASGSSGVGSGSSGGADTGQLMVADGKNLWFYDRELAQVTVKPIGGALSSTPIMLLSGTSEQLQHSFQILPAAEHDGLQWVNVKPRSTQADFNGAELGFQGDRLARMIVHDNLGQTVQLDFSHSERDRPLAATLFQFTPPSGVDVIGTAH